ncbi:hypothetical protein WJX73_002298 [Symbiochloris irregularis]|uniref:Uncharacterized protein n=1 Tax=Symbiochloris irregularis TaxID=706552 RepID=A0AAW1NV37_9CHLO
MMLQWPRRWRPRGDGRAGQHRVTSRSRGKLWTGMAVVEHALGPSFLLSPRATGEDGSSVYEERYSVEEQLDKIDKIAHAASRTAAARPTLPLPAHYPEDRVLSFFLSSLNVNARQWQQQAFPKTTEYRVVHLEGPAGSGKSAQCHNLIPELRHAASQTTDFPYAQRMLEGTVITAYVDFSNHGPASDRITREDFALEPGELLAVRVLARANYNLSIAQLREALGKDKHLLQGLSLLDVAKHIAARHMQGRLPAWSCSKPDYPERSRSQLEAGSEGASATDGAVPGGRDASTTTAPNAAGKGAGLPGSSPCMFVVLDDIHHTMVPRIMETGIDELAARVLCKNLQMELAAFNSLAPSGCGGLQSPSAQAGLMIQPIMAGTGLHSLREGAMPGQVLSDMITLQPMQDAMMKQALAKRMIQSNLVGYRGWDADPALLWRLLNNGAFQAVLEMAGGLPRLGIVWMEQALRHSTWPQTALEELQSDLSDEQAGALVTPLLRQLQKVAGLYMDVGQVYAKTLLGGDRGMLNISLLVATGRPCKLTTRLAGPDGPTIQQAAQIGLFTLLPTGDAEDQVYTLSMPGLIHWSFVSQLAGIFVGFASSTSGYAHCEALQQPVRVFQPDLLTIKYKCEPLQLVRDNVPMMDSSFNLLAGGTVEVSDVGSDKRKHYGERRQCDTLDSTMISLLDGVNENCTAFDLRMVLEPAKLGRKLLLLGELKCQEPGYPGAVRRHLESADVEESRRAVAEWAAAHDCDACFVVIHSGDDEGVDTFLSSEEGQRYATLVVSGEALRRLLPAVGMRPSLLRLYARS